LGQIIEINCENPLTRTNFQVDKENREFFRKMKPVSNPGAVQCSAFDTAETTGCFKALGTRFTNAISCFKPGL
jgi:hypothetical protein